jgi:hypothetical protein
MRKKSLGLSQVTRVVVGMALVAGALAAAAPAEAAPTNTYYAGDVRVYEGNSGPKSRTVAIPITLSNRGTGSQVTIDYTIVPVTATNGPAAPADFTAKSSGQVKFKLNLKNGFTFVKTQIIVKVIADTNVEGDETFEVHFSNPQGGGGFTEGDGISTVTIVDDESQSGAVVNVGDSSMTEGDESNYARTLQLPITLSQPGTGSDVVVTWNVVGTGATCAKAYYGGPTQPGQDCTLFTKDKVTRFKLGVGGTKVAMKASVLVFVDTQVEGDETFEVQIKSVTGGGASVGDGIGVGTIIDDDVAPE